MCGANKAGVLHQSVSNGKKKTWRISSYIWFHSMTQMTTKIIEDKVKRDSNYHISKTHHTTGKLVVVAKIMVT